MINKTEKGLERLDPDDPLVRADVRDIAGRIARKYGLDTSAAEDLEQTVLAILYGDKESGSVREVFSRKAYLWAMIEHSLTKEWKRSHASQTDSVDDDSFSESRLSYEPKVEEEILKKERRRILGKVMKDLNEDEQKLLRLLILNYDQKVIACVLNISHENARKRVSLLKQKLARHVERIERSGSA